MQWSRVKTILIVILLVVDAFLLVNLVGKYAADYYRTVETEHTIIALLEAREIAAGDDFHLPESVVLPVLETEQSRQSEEAFAAGLLGEAAVRSEQPEQPGTVLFESEAGSVQWKDGKVEANLRPANYEKPDTEREMRDLTQELLNQAGITLAVDMEADKETGTVTASYQTAGVPVFNRFLSFSFTEDGINLSGWWTFGVPYMTRSGSYLTCEAADAVFTLIDAQKVSRIDSLEAGYCLTDVGGARVQLSPGWRIVTDQGEFFVDSLKKISILL